MGGRSEGDSWRGDNWAELLEAVVKYPSPIHTSRCKKQRVVTTHPLFFVLHLFHPHPLFFVTNGKKHSVGGDFSFAYISVQKKETPCRQ